MTSVLLAGLGGFVGSAARYALSTWVTSRLAAGTSFPWGTLAVNVLGALAIGIIMGTVMEKGDLPERARLLLVVGVLGGFTTFSAFSSETFTLLARRRNAHRHRLRCRIGRGVAARGLGGLRLRTRYRRLTRRRPLARYAPLSVD